MASIALEVALEAAEAVDVLTETAEVGEAAVETANITAVGDAIDIELGSALNTTIDASISNEVSNVVTEIIQEDISGELEEAVDETTSSGETTKGGDEDSTADEDGKTMQSMLKVIAKWANRILNTYMVLDTVGQLIYQMIVNPGDAAAPALTEEEKKSLDDLSTAVQKMKMIYNSLKDSIKTLSDSTDFLGNEMITETDGTQATVKQVFDSILTTIDQKLTVCRSILARSPFKSKDLNDLGDAIYQTVLRLNALFELRAKSEVLSAYGIPSDDSRATMDEILQLKFVAAHNERIKKIQAVVNDPNTQAHAKAAAVQAASAVIHTDVLNATKAETAAKYQPTARDQAKDAAKDAAKVAADTLIPEYISESQVPFGVGHMLANKVKEQMKERAEEAASKAAKKSMEKYFQTPLVREGVLEIAKEEAKKYAKLKHKQIVVAVNKAVKSSIQVSLKNANL